MRNGQQYTAAHLSSLYSCPSVFFVQLPICLLCTAAHLSSLYSCPSVFFIQLPICLLYTAAHLSSLYSCPSVFFIPLPICLVYTVALLSSLYRCRSVFRCKCNSSTPIANEQSSFLLMYSNEYGGSKLIYAMP